LHSSEYHAVHNILRNSLQIGADYIIETPLKVLSTITQLPKFIVP